MCSHWTPSLWVSLSAIARLPKFQPLLHPRTPTPPAQSGKVHAFFLSLSPPRPQQQYGRGPQGESQGKRGAHHRLFPSLRDHSPPILSSGRCSPMPLKVVLYFCAICIVFLSKGVSLTQPNILSRTRRCFQSHPNGRLERTAEAAPRAQLLLAGAGLLRSALS